MSPKIDKYSAGIRVNRAEQRPERVVETDEKNPRAERLQILRYKTHPQFLARADHENGDEQNDEIASQAEKIGEPARAIHALVLPEARGLFKKRWIEQSLARLQTDSSRGELDAKFRRRSRKLINIAPESVRGRSTYSR